MSSQPLNTTTTTLHNYNRTSKQQHKTGLNMLKTLSNKLGKALGDVFHEIPFTSSKIIVRSLVPLNVKKSSKAFSISLTVFSGSATRRGLGGKTSPSLDKLMAGRCWDGLGLAGRCWAGKAGLGRHRVIATHCKTRVLFYDEVMMELFLGRG